MKAPTLEHLAPYLPYGLKCQYEGILNGSEISKHRREFEKEGEPFIDWQHFEPIEEIKGLKVAPLKTIRVYKKYWVATCGIYNGGQKGFYNGFGLKPILRPLSDYTDINSKAMNDLNWDLSLQIQLQEMATQGGWWNYSALLINECAKEHIDFQNLIQDGLAVDKNTIEL
jgi:hypothetical protein